MGNKVENKHCTPPRRGDPPSHSAKDGSGKYKVKNVDDVAASKQGDARPFVSAPAFGHLIVFLIVFVPSYPKLNVPSAARLNGFIGQQGKRSTSY
jgi:hypothetical protein